MVDLGRANSPSLNLSFKLAYSGETITITVTPQTVIGDVLRESIKPATGKGETDIFLVYLGKAINIFHTFKE